MNIEEITDRLLAELKPMRFSQPVTHVYNPLIYARHTYHQYFSLYGKKPKEILLIGMNPGPYGMVQTGVPFGEVEAVKSWLKIEGEIGCPEHTHPKRPVEGFHCHRSEVSGRRVWGWAKERYGSPEVFARKFLVLNYCPLVFMEESGRNRTPDKLPKGERETLFASCDKALAATVDFYKPEWVIGIGTFVEKRSKEALLGTQVNIGRITHPSPANPKANRGWSDCIEEEFEEMGIKL